MASTKDKSVRSRARATRFGYKVDPKQIFPSGVAEKCVDVEYVPNHTPARALDAVRMPLFRGEERRGLQANHQRITNVLVRQRTN
jgi:hypothetical protein